MTERVRRLTLNTKAGLLKVLRPTPLEERDGDVLIINPWGDLAPLLEAPSLATLIPIVAGEAFSDALHGWHPPFLASMGPEPSIQLRRIPPSLRPCAAREHCGMHLASRCQPGRRMPECWTPEVSPSARQAASLVVRAWVEGFYVVVVDGPEFSLKGGRGC